jgi:hypothetical protein
MSEVTQVSIWGDRTFHIDCVDCTVDLGTVNDNFEGVIIKASFYDVTEQGTANGKLVRTDNAIIQKYIDDLPVDQYTSEDELFYEAFIEAVTDMCDSIGPCVTVGPIDGPSSCRHHP